VLSSQTRVKDKFIDVRTDKCRAGNGELCVTVKMDFVELMEAIATQKIHMQAMHIAALWSTAHFILKSKELGSEFDDLRARLRQFIGL
jgi:hypothetical protein